MIEVSDHSFGALVAYLIPGFLVLLSLADDVPLVASWLAADPSVGGFLFAVLAGLGLGMFVSALRWLAIDTLHHRTGVVRPRWNHRALAEAFAPFEGAVQNHYRYYQHYANTLTALVLIALFDPATLAALGESGVVRLGRFAGIAGVLLVASRNSLACYYEMTGALLRSEPLEEVDHDQRLSSPQDQTPGPAGATGRETQSRPSRPR